MPEVGPPFATNAASYYERNEAARWRVDPGTAHRTDECLPSPVSACVPVRQWSVVDVHDLAALQVVANNQEVPIGRNHDRSSVAFRRGVVSPSSVVEVDGERIALSMLRTMPPIQVTPGRVRGLPSS